MMSEYQTLKWGFNFSYGGGCYLSAQPVLSTTVRPNSLPTLHGSHKVAMIQEHQQQPGEHLQTSVVQM
jgi:hypothetical protein